MRVHTVGDEIFALRIEIKELKRQIQQYKALVRRMAEEKANHPIAIKDFALDKEV